MNCESAGKQLDDFMDGDLTPALEADVRLHLESCKSCGEQLAEMEALLGGLATLPVEEEPSRDLWNGVEPRLQPRTAGRGSFYGRWPVLAAAAVLLLALVAAPAILKQGAEQVDNAGRSATASPAAATVVDPGSAIAGSLKYKELDARFAMVRDQLRLELAVGDHQLDPETLELIQKNLKVMEEAAAEIGNALEKDPGNTGLRKMLMASYKQQVYWLNQFRDLPETL